MSKNFNKFFLIGLLPFSLFPFAYALQIDTTVRFQNGKIDLSEVKQSYKICKEHDMSGIFMDQIYDQVIQNIHSLCNNAQNPKNCRKSAQSELNAIVGIASTSKRASKTMFRGYNEELLHSKCESDCEKLNILPALTHGLGWSEKAYNAVKEKSKTCQEKILNNLIDELAKERIPKACLSESSESLVKGMEVNLILAQNRESAVRNIKALARAQSIRVAEVIDRLILEHGHNKDIRKELMSLAKEVLSSKEHAGLLANIHKRYELHIGSILSDKSLSDDEVFDQVKETEKRYGRSVGEVMRTLVEKVEYGDERGVMRVIKVVRRSGQESLARQVESQFLMHVKDPQSLSRVIGVLAEVNKVSREEMLMKAMQTVGRYSEQLRAFLWDEAFDKKFTVIVHWVKRDPKKFSYLLDRRKEEVPGKVNAFLSQSMGGSGGSYMDGLEFISSLEKGGKLDLQSKGKFWETLIGNGQFNQVTGAMEHFFSRQEKRLGLELFRAVLSSDSVSDSRKQYVVNDIAPKLIGEGKLTYLDLVSTLGRGVLSAKNPGERHYYKGVGQACIFARDEGGKYICTDEGSQSYKCVY